MDFSNIKLIVSDMDGTLLNSDHQVSDQFFQTFRILKQKNILFAVASGRQYYSLRERMKPIQDELIYIAENGAIAMEAAEEIFIQPMEPTIVHQLIKEIREIGGKYLILCGKKKAYIESTDPEFMEPFLGHYDKYQVVDDLLSVKDDVLLKLTICDLQGAEEHSFPMVKHYRDSLQVKLSGKIWIDFTHLQAQKGNALKALQEKYGIQKAETLAFGDYLNDLELFDRSGISYAVDNAHPEVKKVATNSTKSNNDRGVEIILEELLEQLKVRAD